MKKKNQLLPVLAIGLLAGPIAAQADFNYEVVDQPGAPNTQFFGINDRGNVVGNGFGGGTFPFVYDSKTGTFMSVAEAPGFFTTSIIGNNDAGVMVGSVFNLDSVTRSGFIRDTQGNYTIFDHPDAGSSTVARAVNNRGLVTGFYRDINFLIVGFIYDPKSNSFTDMNSTGFGSVAAGINSKGEVVGHAHFFFADDPCPGLGNPFSRFGWLRAKDGTVTYFEVNGSRTSARGINDKGSIVGFFFDLNDGKFKGFKVELDGSQCQSLTVAAGDILDVPGSTLTLALAISNSGVIVGRTRDANGEHGFIARPE